MGNMQRGTQASVGVCASAEGFVPWHGAHLGRPAGQARLRGSAVVTLKPAMNSGMGR
jgi:hypothetical protein